MAPGTQVTDYHNSASTTTSGQKTSDASNRSSDRNRFGPHTQSTNGATQLESQPNWPDFDSLLPPFEGGSQIPDTQSTSSIPLGARLARPTHGKMTRASTVCISASMPLTIVSEHAVSNLQHGSSQSSGSQAHAFPKPALPAHVIAAQQPQNQNTGLATAPPSSFVDAAGAAQASNSAASNGMHQAHTSNIADALNPPQPQPEFILDEISLQAMHNNLAERTNGLTVEQIEMVMARCMDIVLRMRHLWDRSDVIEKLDEAVAEVLADVMWQNGLGMEGVEWTG
jgi:ATPase family AAA domain-containing protein 2